MIEEDFDQIVNDNTLAGIPATDRLFSFDLCYQYFRRPKEQIKGNIEESCYALWSFLASWGMLRASTELFQKNPICLKEIVLYIADNDLSDIDLEHYADENVRHRIIDAYETIEHKLKDNSGIQKPTITLITKILLGTSSCIPAFDVNFCKFYMNEFGHRCRRIDDRTLIDLCSVEPYIGNVERLFVIFSGDVSERCYNKVKLLDLYGWKKGRQL